MEWSSLPNAWQFAKWRLQSFADRAMAFGSLLISGGVVLVCLAASINFGKNISLASALVIPVCVLGIAVSVGQIGYTIAAMVRPQLPAALQVALSQPTWPRGLRWLFAIWWAGHFGVGVVLALSVLEAGVPEVGAIVIFSLMSVAFT